jgi:U4/U6.U5 tri-snRNP component SNU23
MDQKQSLKESHSSFSLFMIKTISMANFRRTWDKNAYEAKAALRQEMGDEAFEQETLSTKKIPLKEEFKMAREDAPKPMGSERAFLNARQEKIDIDSKVGTVQVVDPSHLEKGAGYWCEVCACLSKDSASYLDHINGKKRKFYLI